MELSKTEVKKELRTRKLLALHSNAKGGRYSSTAKGFLEDLNNFKEVFDEIEDNEKFHIVTENRLYKLKQRCNILFDSFSIVLLQGEDMLHMYYMPKYQLK